MPEKFEISIISPVYKAQGVVAHLVSRIVTSLEGITQRYEILLVEDGSPDGSWQEIQQAASVDPRVRGVRLDGNFGQHAAISAGLLLARGEHVVVMDCDLEDPPEEIPRLYAKALEGFRIVMARRWQRESSLAQRIGSRAFYLALSLTRGIKTDHRLGNFAIYHREVIESYRPLADREEPFSVIGLRKRYPFAVVDVQCEASARRASGYTFARRVRLGLSLLFPRRKHSSGKKPLFRLAPSETLSLFVEGYGVALRRLTRDKIEMVRNWRNDPKIAQWMNYREYITPQMQQQWFDALDEQRKHYFIIEHEGHEVGLINCNIVDPTSMVAEGGLFIWQEECRDNGVPFRASMLMIDIATRELGVRRGIVRVRQGNTKADEYNRMLGYVRIPGQEGQQEQLYALDYGLYLRNRERIASLLQ